MFYLWLILFKLKLELLPSLFLTLLVAFSTHGVQWLLKFYSRKNPNFRMPEIRKLKVVFFSMLMISFNLGILYYYVFKSLMYLIPSLIVISVIVFYWEITLTGELNNFLNHTRMWFGSFHICFPWFINYFSSESVEYLWILFLMVVIFSFICGFISRMGEVFHESEKSSFEGENFKDSFS